MKPLTLGEVSVTSVVERDGPWLSPRGRAAWCWLRSPIPTALVMPAHFPGPTAGHVVPDGDSFRFRFLDG